MNEVEEYTVNDTTRNIRNIRKDLEDFKSPYCDQRIKAMINSKLQEAELLSLLLIKDED